MNNLENSNKQLRILNAALPYIPPKLKPGISMYLKINELRATAFNSNYNRSNDDLSACENNSSVRNSEYVFKPYDLLVAVKDELSNPERELVDMIFNTINTIRIYNVCKTVPTKPSKNESDYKNNPKKEDINMNIDGISQDKLKDISEIIEKSKHVSDADKFSFLLEASQKLNSKGLSFSESEKNTIINSLKEGMDEAQRNKIDNILNLAKSFAVNN